MLHFSGHFLYGHPHFLSVLNALRATPSEIHMKGSVLSLALATADFGESLDSPLIVKAVDLITSLTSFDSAVFVLQPHITIFFSPQDYLPLGLLQ